jgi:squalene-hopene/tetraprenyl-beta-curcumene cyclase
MTSPARRIRLVAVTVVALLAACGKADDTKKPPAEGSGKPAAGQPAGGYGAGGYAPGGYGYAAALGDDVDRQVGNAVTKGRKWLLGKRDAGSGSWGPEGVGPNVGYTALAAVGIAGTTARDAVKSDPIVLAALDFLLAAQKEDGSISSNPQFTNYETSSAVLAFTTAKVAKYASAQAKARDFLAASQVAGDPNDPSYGGFPYQSKRDPTRPTDLSNLQWGLTALHDAELPKDSPVWKRSEQYLARVQNHSETNTYRAKTKEGEVVSGNDGGGFYAPGVSMAQLVKRPDGSFEARSYGSMTYALLKCLLFAGVKADDERVKAAVAWLERNFTVDRNPGREHENEKAGREGYYYYLLTMARAASEYEKATGKAWKPKDAAGKEHEWRKELGAKVASLQRADGSWVNEGADRWEEGDPVLVTSYALQTLALCQGRLP